LVCTYSSIQGVTHKKSPPPLILVFQTNNKPQQLEASNSSTMKEQIQRHASNNPVYGMGFIGALVYYISHATSFWMGVLGILKAIFWPGFLVYEALKALGM
jgi:hypothetical protein